MTIQDEIIALGTWSFGMLSRPSAERRTDTCVVLLNAGLIHRSGPFRLYTRLARELAATGVATFRFDAPGIGDSIERGDVPLVQATQACLDALQARCGYSRFVVGGICSAADHGWMLALADPRVVGLIAIDGMAREGFWHLVGRLRRGLRKTPAEWLQVVGNLLQPPPALQVSSEDLRDWPERGAEQRQLQALVERGVQLFVLFTGGTSYFLHRRQWRATFGSVARSPTIDFHYWPNCDHTFFAESDRLQLFCAVSKWASERFRQAA